MTAILLAQPAVAEFGLLSYVRHPETTADLKRAGVRAQLYHAMTMSMAPLIAEGDLLVGDLRGGAGRMPQRGEVIAFRGPEKLIYFKRVVGLPGDIVAFEGARLILNGRPTTPDDWPGVGDGDWTAAEILPWATGPAHSVLCRGADLENTASMPALTVPDGMVFVAGDQRCSSVDSRFFGPVKREAILARMILRLEPNEFWLVERDSLIP